MKHAYGRRRAADVKDRNEFIIEAYAFNVSIAMIATVTGMTYETVKVTASRLGCTRSPKHAADFRRGFVIPPDRMEEYMSLQRYGYSSAERAAMMGIEVRK